jgi:transcriptional regulator with XRE-family HTH domain
LPTNVSPEVRRRRLAAELRHLRTRAGLTVGEVAKLLGWSPSKVSRYELARTGLKPPDVRQMLAIYKIDAQRQKELLALAKEATEKGWWEWFSGLLSDEHISLIGLEDEAIAERAWHLDVIPGLLQSEEYAREVNSKGYSLAPVPPRQIERSVNLRMRRQKLLTKDPPLKLEAVLDEAVLRRRVGDDRLMQHQLQRLRDLAQLPNVSVRVLKLSFELPIYISSFTLLHFGATMPDVVYTEHFRANLYFEDESDTLDYEVVFKRLQEGAISESDSLDFIGQIAREVWA